VGRILLIRERDEFAVIKRETRLWANEYLQRSSVYRALGKGLGSPKGSQGKIRRSGYFVMRGRGK